MTDGIAPEDTGQVEPQESQEPESGQESEGTGYNPAWDEAWADVPEPIRESQKQVFEKWDRNVQHLQAKFAPYKQFEEQGVTADALQQAYSIQQALVSDPRGFWDRMAETWGFASGAEAQQAYADANEDEDDPTASIQREIAELREWRESQENMTRQQMAQYQQQQEQLQWQARINDELGSLKQKFRDVDENAVIERALLNATQGRNPSLENAYFEVRDYEDRIAQRAQRKAPRVMGAGGGSSPAPQQKALTADEQAQASRDLAKRLAGG